MNDSRPYMVIFDDIYSADTQKIIKVASDNFGQAFAIKENTDCKCDMIQIYPEVMVFCGGEKKFTCPFCYRRQEYNNDWGYEVFHTLTEDESYYGYRLVVSFRNDADACFFYTFLSSTYGRSMSLINDN